MASSKEKFEICEKIASEFILGATKLFNVCVKELTEIDQDELVNEMTKNAKEVPEVEVTSGDLETFFPGPVNGADGVSVWPDDPEHPCNKSEAPQVPKGIDFIIDHKGMVMRVWDVSDPSYPELLFNDRVDMSIEDALQKAQKIKEDYAQELIERGQKLLKEQVEHLDRTEP